MSQKLVTFKSKPISEDDLKGPHRDDIISRDLKALIKCESHINDEVPRKCYYC